MARFQRYGPTKRRSRRYIAIEGRFFSPEPRGPPMNMWKPPPPIGIIMFRTLPHPTGRSQGRSQSVLKDALASPAYPATRAEAALARSTKTNGTRVVSVRLILETCL